MQDSTTSGENSHHHHDHGANELSPRVASLISPRYGADASNSALNIFNFEGYDDFFDRSEYDREASHSNGDHYRSSSPPLLLNSHKELHETHETCCHQDGLDSTLDGDGDQSIWDDNDHFQNIIKQHIPHFNMKQKKRNQSAEVDTSVIPNNHVPSNSSSSAQSSNAPKISKNQVGPKRPRTAYIIFLEHFRQSYHEKFPNASFNDCQKFAGKKWRSLSEAEKKPWKELETLSQKDFIHKMHGLRSSFGLVNKDPPSSQVSLMHSSQSDRINELLKGPKNAFSIFVQAMREDYQKEDPKLTYNEIQKKLSVRWRQMPSQEKEVWIEKSREVKRQLEHYNAEMAVRGLDRGSKKGSMRKVKKGISLPKGPRSAYTLFYQCARKQLHQARPDLSFEEYPTICSKIWREMPEKEKELWKIDSANDKRRYEEELLALAHSDVANTATSIVMEEKYENLSNSSHGEVGSAPKKKRGRHNDSESHDHSTSSTETLNGNKEGSSGEPWVVVNDSNTYRQDCQSSNTQNGISSQNIPMVGLKSGVLKSPRDCHEFAANGMESNQDDSYLDTKHYATSNMSPNDEDHNFLNSIRSSSDSQEMDRETLVPFSVLDNYVET